MLLDGSLRSLAVLGGAVGSSDKLLFHSRRRHGFLQLISRFMLCAPDAGALCFLHMSVSHSAVLHQIEVLAGELLCANWVRCLGHVVET